VDISYFTDLIGENYVLTDEGSLQSFGTDWTKVHAPNPSAILLPGSTEEVSKILKYCNDQKISVVPSGGRTGLTGAAVAANGELVLSLNRMNKIERVDTVGLTITAQAGVTTQELQEAAKEVGLLFPVDLAAKGSCQIGGNIATNAGGVKLIRYGGTREQVLGLEVVLPNGEVLDINRGLRKNNTGYDLKQLFIGSEGTLGIVTRATLKLVPKPRNVQLALLAVESFGHVPQILQCMSLEGAQITAFEFFTLAAHEKVLQHSPGAKSPFPDRYPIYVLIEVEEGPVAGAAVMEPLLEKIFEKDLIKDAVIAGSSAQSIELWGLRENITESLAANGHVRKNDISLAIDQLDGFIVELEKILSHDSPIEMVVFGHIGDGNLHINYIADRDTDAGEFAKVARAIEVQVFELLKTFRGSISAEHGVGLLKKNDLHYTIGDDELAIMRQIKKIFDPNGIMNPGKIFD
jgi:glycolate oxidase subunit GlcD